MDSRSPTPKSRVSKAGPKHVTGRLPVTLMEDSRRNSAHQCARRLPEAWAKLRRWFPPSDLKLFPKPILMDLVLYAAGDKRAYYRLRNRGYRRGTYRPGEPMSLFGAKNSMEKWKKYQKKGTTYARPE